MRYTLSSIVGVALCAVVVAAGRHSSPQTTGTAQGSTFDWDQLLRDRRYLELEKALSSPKMTGSDRAFFEGVMANRRNRVSESVRMLEPLVSSLATTNKERVVIALSTLA